MTSETRSRRQLVGQILEAGQEPRQVQIIADEVQGDEIITAFADGDATPSVSERNTIFKTANTGATTITDLDDGFSGQQVTIVFGDANTTVDFTASGLIGNGGVDWTPGLNEQMTCTYDGTDWYCAVPPAGSGGDVTVSGTPVDNQVAIWISATSIEGDASLTYNGDILNATRVNVATGGSAASPTLRLGDGDSGFYEPTDDTIRFVSQGGSIFELMNTGIRGLGANNGSILLGNTASSTNPIYSFRGDEDTGINRGGGADTLSLIAGATEMFRVTETVAENYNTTFYPLFIAEQTSAGANQTGYGQLWAGTDNSLNFTDEAGTNTVLTAGGGNVSNTGTPLDNQIAVWTDATTIEGDANFTWNGASQALTVNGNISVADNQIVQFGTGLDGNILFNPTGDQLEISTLGTSDIAIFTAVTDTSVLIEANAGVTLYWDNAARVATTLAGATVTGDLTTTGDVIVNTALKLIDTGTEGEIRNGADELLMTFLNTDGGVVRIDEPQLRIPAGNNITLFGSGGQRARFLTDASGFLRFTSDSTAPVAGVFDYPVGLVANNVTKPATPTLGTQIVNAGSALFEQIPTSGNTYPLSNQQDRVWRFNSPTTAADPGATFMRFNNTDITQVTQIYFDDLDYVREDCDYFFARMVVGDNLLIHQPTNKDRWGHFEVVSITNNTGWWTVVVTYQDSGLTGAGSTLVNGVATSVQIFKSSLIPAVTYGDNDLLQFGDGLDVDLSYQSTGDFFRISTLGTTDFQVVLGATQQAIYAQAGAQVELNYNTTTRLATTATGVSVTGDIAVTGNVDGRDISGITATNAELNLLDLSGLTAGWALIADTATTASWQAISITESQISDLGNYADISGTPVDNQVAVWTDADTVEGTSGLTYDGSTLNVTGNVSGTQIGGIVEDQLVAKNADEIITGNWTFRTNASGDFRIERQGATASDASVIEYANLDGVKGYAGYTDSASFQTSTTTQVTLTVDSSGNVSPLGNIVMNASATVDGRDLSVDGAKLDLIENGATQDQTAGEIEAIVSHDNLLDFVANEHINWTSATSNFSTTGTLGASTTTLTGGSAQVLSLKAGATVDHVYMAWFADSAAQSTRSAYMGFGSAGSNVLTIDNELGTRLSLPDTLDVGGNIELSDNAQLQFGNGLDVDLSYQATGDFFRISTLGTTDFEVVLGATSRAIFAEQGAGVELNYNNGPRLTTTAAGVDVNETLNVTGTAPQIYLRDTNATTDEKNWIVRGDADQFRIQTATDAAPGSGVANLLSATRTGTTVNQVNLGNYNFDVDQTVGAGQDNYVLTYDHTDGQISLEAAASGGPAAGTVTGSMLRWSGSAWVEEASARLSTTGQLWAAGGSAATPDFAFVSETNTGLYRPSTFQLGAAVNGTQVFGITTTDFDLKTDLDIDDNKKITFGTGDDLQIYHNGSTTNYIDNIGSTTSFQLRVNSTEIALLATPNGATATYHNGTQVARTQASTSEPGFEVLNAGNWETVATEKQITEQYVKTADESVVSSTTLQDDNHLTGMTLDADTRYRIEVYFEHFGSTSGDLKFLWVFSQTPQDYGSFAYNNWNGFSPGTPSMYANPMTTTFSAIGTTSTGHGALVGSGNFRTNATTGGTLKLQWAQNASNTTATSLRAGSHVILTRLD